MKSITLICKNEIHKETSMRRLKRIIIPEDLLIDLLSCRLLNNKYVNIPVGSSLPEDVKILSIDKDLARNALSIIVEHSSFDEVASGSEIPLYGGFDIQCQTFKVSDLVEVDRSKWCNKLMRWLV